MTYIIIAVSFVANLRILLALRSTDLFGQVIKNLYLMIIKTISFALLLILSVVAFGAYIFVTMLGKYPWTAKFGTTWSYLVDSMLGNYEAEDWTVEVAGWQGLITFILF